MVKYTILSIAGLVVLLLGAVAFLGGIGQYQAEHDFDKRLTDDRARFEQTNATGGYDLCAYNNNTSTLDCPDNPYTGGEWWLLGGFLMMAVGGVGIYYDMEVRDSRRFDQ